jgi:hypothetical protein
MLQIDKGVPMPEKRRGKNSLVDWGAMEVGDSFEWPPGVTRSVTKINERLAPKKFTTRKLGDRVRVWRVK